VDVRAVSDRLLHSIGEIPERAEHALVGYRDARSDAALVYDDVDVLRLEATQNGLFTTSSG
jgi:hypothetical protein